MSRKAPAYRVWKLASHPDAARANNIRRMLFWVNSPDEASTVIRQLRNREKEDPTRTESVYGLEVLTSGGWSEWHGAS